MKAYFSHAQRMQKIPKNFFLPSYIEAFMVDT